MEQLNKKREPEDVPLTGAGKKWFVENMLEQISKREIPILVIDPEKEEIPLYMDALPKKLFDQPLVK